MSLHFCLIVRFIGDKTFIWDCMKSHKPLELYSTF